MAAIADVCCKLTVLTPEQVALLDEWSVVFPLVCDLAHAQLTVYVQSHKINGLFVAAQFQPHTSFSNDTVNQPGAWLTAVEEPLVWRTMQTGRPICGQREWRLGRFLEMQTYPLHDGDGAMIAVVSFETSLDEAKAQGYDILRHTAYQLLVYACHPVEGMLYRPLAAGDGIVISDAQDKILFANAAAAGIYKVLGVGRMVGSYLHDQRLNTAIVKPPGSHYIPSETVLEAGSLSLIQRTIPIVHAGRLVCTITLVTDVTALKKKEKQLLIKSAVIQEIHHRVKNNLQTIASLLRLQARRTSSSEVKVALGDSINRILSISVVHEFLSQQDAECINVAEVARNILDLVIENMLEPGFELQTAFNGQTVVLPSQQASSLALVINELVQNSLEHAFPDRCTGLIGVDISTVSNRYQIVIYDNGIGLPSNFQVTALKSLGLQIVKTLIEEDLGGSFVLNNQNGTRACITIPRQREEVCEDASIAYCHCR